MVRDIFNLDRPVEDRVVNFNCEPDDRQLGTDLGYGLMGSSGTSLNQKGEIAKVEPMVIPIKLAAVWMYFVSLLIVAILIITGTRDMLPWVILGFACVIIIPFMMSVLSWVNQQTGNVPYLVFNKSEGTVELPRLSRKFVVDQLRQIVFLDRFVDGNRFFQVALLVEEEDRWTYVHLFNDGGARSGPAFLGVKELYEKIGDLLGIESRSLKFSRKESLALTDDVRGDWSLQAASRAL